ncbi:MAG TPA: hypothetical protein VI912_00790 [Candidatus Bilamarchaeaceae archaeon]|nr:hypothetical protein [Candidatus Bilamarchaeaceae archaeon]
MKRLTFNGPRVRQLTDAITHPRRTWHGYLLSAELSSQSGIAKALLPRKLKEKLPALREEYEREIGKVNGRDENLFYARMWRRCAEVFSEIEQMAGQSETPPNVATKLWNLAEEVSGEIKRTGYSNNRVLCGTVSWLSERSAQINGLDSISKLNLDWVTHELKRLEENAKICEKNAELFPVDIKSRSVFLDAFVRMPAVATTVILAGSHVSDFLNASVDPELMTNKILGMGAFVLSTFVAGLATLFALDNIERFTNGWKKQKDRFFDSASSFAFSFGGVLVALGVSLVTKVSLIFVPALLAITVKREISALKNLSRANPEKRKEIVRNEMHEYKLDSITTNLKQSWEDLDKPVALLTVANTAIWSGLAVISFSTFGFWAVPLVAIGIYASANSHK